MLATLAGAIGAVYAASVCSSSSSSSSSSSFRLPFDMFACAAKVVAFNELKFRACFSEQQKSVSSTQKLCQYK